MGLTFDTLRAANLERAKHYSPERGVDVWDPAEWIMALVGELGELANILKKVKRGDMPFKDVELDVGNELADVQTYLDLLAARLDIDLGRVTIEKFNAISRRVGSAVRIREDGSDYRMQRS